MENEMGKPDVKITRLNARESAVLHALKRSRIYWHQKVLDRSYTGRDDDERDLCCDARTQFDEIITMMLTGDYL